MGDVGGDFRAYKEMVKDRKLERLKNNTEQLKDIDIPYTRDSSGTIHFQTKKERFYFIQQQTNISTSEALNEVVYLRLLS